MTASVSVLNLTPIVTIKKIHTAPAQPNDKASQEISMLPRLAGGAL